MVFIKCIAFFLFCALLTNSTYAQEELTEEAIEKKLEICLDENYTTMGMIECMNEYAKNWDTLLNKYYKLLKAELKQDGKNYLKEAEIAWIKFRDAENELIEHIFTSLEGTMYLPMLAEEKATLIKTRALQLKSYYQELQNAAY